MNELMNEWRNEWMKEWMNEGMNEWVNDLMWWRDWIWLIEFSLKKFFEQIYNFCWCEIEP